MSADGSPGDGSVATLTDPVLLERLALLSKQQQQPGNGQQAATSTPRRGPRKRARRLRCFRATSQSADTTTNRSADAPSSRSHTRMAAKGAASLLGIPLCEKNTAKWRSASFVRSTTFRAALKRNEESRSRSPVPRRRVPRRPAASATTRTTARAGDGRTRPQLSARTAADGGRAAPPARRAGRSVCGRVRVGVVSCCVIHDATPRGRRSCVGVCVARESESRSARRRRRRRGGTRSFVRSRRARRRHVLSRVVVIEARGRGGGREKRKRVNRTATEPRATGPRSAATLRRVLLRRSVSCICAPRCRAMNR